MTSTKSQFLISAPSSNSGKTSVTLGLLRALKNQGMKVQPFKCGPDYIDTIHHTLAAGKQSINLDTFMSSPIHVQEIYAEYSRVADVSLTEGVMGLFDGADKMQGSSAAIAELLNIPVILVVNAKSMAYSAAPLLYGFKNFYKGINVVGVIFNFVNTESHYRFLQDACEDVGIEALGYLPKDDCLAIPSRHLGLHISSGTDYELIIENLAESISKTVNTKRLLEITRIDVNATNMDCDDDFNPQVLSFDTKFASPEPRFVSPQTVLHKSLKVCGDTDLGCGNNDLGSLKISIARDEAFSFIYHQNIEVLSTFGKITWFSPLHDERLPDSDLLYLPGGYPELFAKELSENLSMRASIQSYCQKGGLAYAECGGLMYLGKSIVTDNGNEFEMAGVFDCSTTMQNKKMTLGYRIADWKGFEFRGHEFHYSGLKNSSLPVEHIIITNAKGLETDTKIYKEINTYASYMHVYWGDNAEFIEMLLKSAKSNGKLLKANS